MLRAAASHVARPPDTTVVTISAYDSHPDHRLCGHAVQRLHVDGYVSQPAYVISPERLDFFTGSIVLNRVGSATPIQPQAPASLRRWSAQV